MSTATDLHDKRRTPRRPLARLVRVIDSATQQTVGKIVNLSAEGFMLISKMPLAVNQPMLLLLELSDDAGSGGMVRLQACCLWCAPSSYSPDYGAGFEITHIAAGDRLRLQQWYRSATG